VIRATTSHFNLTTPFNAGLVTLMGISISFLWVGRLVLTLLLLRTPIADAADRWAMRSGALVSLVGMGLGVAHAFPDRRTIDPGGAGHSRPRHRRPYRGCPRRRTGHADHRLEHRRRRPAHPALRGHARTAGPPPARHAADTVGPTLDTTARRHRARTDHHRGEPLLHRRACAADLASPARTAPDPPRWAHPDRAVGAAGRLLRERALGTA